MASEGRWYPKIRQRGKVGLKALSDLKVGERVENELIVSSLVWH
jgi:hypothetical protein